MLPVSKSLWIIIPLINKIEFTYRLLAITVLVTALIAGIIVKNLKKNWLIILFCAFVIFSTILNWGNRGTIPDIGDSHFRTNLPYSTYQVEGLGPVITKWSNNLWQTNTPKARIQILEGKGKVVESHRSSTEHEYVILAESNLRIKENTLYFPGWNLLINSKQRPINYLDTKFPGVMTFSLKPGLYRVDLHFRDRPIKTLTKIVSLLALVYLAGLLVYSLSSRKRGIQKKGESH
jgi:hypothetical protein